MEKKVDVVTAQSSSKQEVAKLSDDLRQQVSTILRSNAETGAKFDELMREMQNLAGKLEESNRRLAQLSQQIAESQRGQVQVSPAAPQAPGTPPAPAGRGPSPSDLFTQATADYQRGQYELARQGFEEYVETYPKTDLSDDAVYWSGECWMAQKKPREAISTFGRLFSTYPQSDKAAPAHLKKAVAHLDLGEKAQAIVELQFVVHEYPSSDEAKSARQRLRALGSDVR